MSGARDVVVVGGGHNGLTAAAWLARRGRRVVVVERRERLGGLAASEQFHPGYRTAGVLHDTAAVRDWVVAGLELERHGLERRVPPPVLVPATDGPGLLLERDPAAAADELARLAPADVEAYAAYRSFVERVAPALGRLTDRPPPDLFDPGVADLWSLGRSALALRLLGRRRMMELLRAAPSPVADWLDERFAAEPLKAALAAPAVWSTWCGPRSPGTTANLLVAEAAAGRPVAGGAPALVRALEGASRAAGVELRTGAEVERLLLDGPRVTGVRLAGGDEIAAPVVVATCDPRQLFLRLLPPAALTGRLGRDVANYRVRGTTAKVDLALDGYPELACRPGFEAEEIRTGESLEEQERAFDAVKYRRFSARPVLDVRLPTVESPELAPPGHHVASILVHFAPYELEGGWGEERNEELLEAVLGVLEAYAPRLREQIVGRRVSSPADLERRFALTGGHLHHGEHALDQLAVRPTPECARYSTPYPGLYLGGSGSHPGGGLTCAPGALAAGAVLAE